ncbi:LPXTG cell wall anchor domain-containing protein, partial [Actinospica durhamensis]
CPPSTHPITPVTASLPPSTTPPVTPSTTPSMWTGPHTPPPGLAHTGADVDVALGVAGAALIAGLGLRLAARRREER